MRVISDEECPSSACAVPTCREHHPEAAYYQRLKINGKWSWQALGTDPATVLVGDLLTEKGEMTQLKVESALRPASSARLFP
jgi:hypothetical protein